VGKFYSDDEVKKLESEGKVKKNFISDEEMAAIEADKPKMGFIESQVEALPIYGAAAGGVLGLPAGPVGSVAGAGLGAGLGQSLRDIIKRQAYGEKKGLAETFIDPTKAIAEGAASEMGGFVIGKGLGAGIGKIKKELDIGKSIADVLQSPKPIDTPDIKIDAPEFKISGGGAELEQSGQLFEYKAPQSLEELRNWKPEAGAGELLGKTRLKEIEAGLPELKIKPLNYHYDLMENPKSMKELKLTFENLPTKDAKQIASYNQELIKDSENIIKNTVNKISKSPPKSLNDAGEDLMLKVKNKYSDTKDYLSPAFEKMKETGINLTDKNTKDLINTIGTKSKIGGLIQETAEPILQDGKVVGQKIKISLAPNAPRTGLSSNEYKVISEVVNDLNNGATFEEIQRMRDYLRKAKDPLNSSANEEIEKVRKVLLDSLETMTPQEVRPIMQQYAINEKALDNVEQIIGGKIETLDKMFAANPEKIINKIFSNPNYAKIVEDYVGKEAVNDMVSSYVNSGIQASIDSATGFNPVKARQWLKTNSNFVKNYVDPELANKLSLAADYGYYGKRFLDEVNPSGTAASLKAMIEPKGLVQKLKSGQITGAITGAAAEKLGGAFEQRQALSRLDEILRGVQDLKPKQTPSVTSRLFPLTEQTAVPLAERTGQSLLMTEQNRSPISRRLQQLKGGK